MGKGKSPYSLYKRPANSKEAVKKRKGKSFRFIYYCQFRNSEGDYTSGLSTHETSKGAAKKWAFDYLKKGDIPINRGFTFEKFSKDWWIPDQCQYLKERERMGHKLSPRYIEGSRRNLDKYILPYFGPNKMTSISFKDIRRWMFELTDNNNLSPAIANRNLACLKVM
ncbi:unnamed protein product, partial [marine sediment metagenome]